MIMLIFPITSGFCDSVLASIPQQQCQALAPGCSRGCDTEGDKDGSAQPRWSKLSFSQQTRAAVQGKPRPQQLHVCSALAVFRTPDRKGVNHHWGFCSWDADRAGKIEILGRAIARRR